MQRPSYVVTGGARGIGRDIARRLAQDGLVVVVDLEDDLDPDPSVVAIAGNLLDPGVALTAAARAEAGGPLVGWVNNAAVFRDAALDSTSAATVLDLITANLGLAVIGCHVAVNHFLRNRRPGAIVNVSSHHAQRAVRGALPYSTAKAAIEGLTRAVAVDHGRSGIRTNAVALGSIATPRYEAYVEDDPELGDELAALHPLGRIGTGGEVADAVAYLLSDRAGFVNGAVLPVDGGRAAWGPDPEST